MPESSFDVIVIGGGPPGIETAVMCQTAGLSTALVERELVGGECHYWGCIPSKTLLRPNEALAQARKVPGAREAIAGGVDASAALARRDVNVDHWDDAAVRPLVEEAGVTLVRGHGRLAGEREVEVEDSGGEGQRLSARRAVVLAPGSATAFPSVEGLLEAAPWDNRRGTDSGQVPARLLVLGGGAVGVELAQAWRSLGANQVTLAEQQERLLPDEEPFAGEALAEALRDGGVEVRTGSEVTRIAREGEGGPVRATLADGSEVVADEVIVATGRRARSDDLGVETVGLEPGEFVAVDERLRVRGVDGDWLYAIADVTGIALFTHMGRYHARLAVGHIVGGDGPTARDDAVPRVVFTEPQVAAVGLTQTQARERGLEVRVTTGDLGATDGAAVAGEGVGGTAQLVIDSHRDVIVGATFVASDAIHLMHAATLAIVGEASVTTLREHAVPPFPTVHDVWLELLAAG